MKLSIYLTKQELAGKHIDEVNAEEITIMTWSVFQILN